MNFTFEGSKINEIFTTKPDRRRTDAFVESLVCARHLAGAVLPLSALIVAIGACSAGLAPRVANYFCALRFINNSVGFGNTKLDLL